MTELLTASQTADRLGLSTRKVYDLATAGKLASYHFDSSVRFDLADIDAYKTSCRSHSARATSAPFHEWVANTVANVGGNGAACLQALQAKLVPTYTVTRMDACQVFFAMWPTPRAQNPGSRPNGKGGKILEEEVQIAEGLRERGARKWATPTVNGNYNRVGVSATSGDGLATQVGGSLNPTWVEWLMGWPLGWTDLKPLVTVKFPCVQQPLTACSVESENVRGSNPRQTD